MTRGLFYQNLYLFIIYLSSIFLKFSILYVVVSLDNLDNRQNSPIAVPAARVIPYLRPMNLPDGPGSEAHSDDCGKSLNRDDILSTAEQSEAPLTQRNGGRSRRRSLWSFFSKNVRRAITNNNNNSVDNNSDYHDHHNNEASSSVLCCNIQ
jgi:hypothetical protein